MVRDDKGTAGDPSLSVRLSPTLTGWIDAVMPPTGSVRRTLLIAASAGLVIATLGSIAGLGGTAIFFTSWASSAAILLSTPAARACHPRRIAASHITAATVGLVCSSGLAATPCSLGTAVAISIAIVMLADLLHPPAMANAAFAFSAPHDAVAFLGTAALGAIGLALLAMVLQGGGCRVLGGRI
ncbi:HPP family protein [Sphingobium sp. B2]|uniref:HPP family protein n=1 Tax=Sphingobium sp. B2 TaxID=2583228 RepID=UPI0011A1ACBD|nr:HPP family protein [Sphingobium sp. B2]